MLTASKSSALVSNRVGPRLQMLAKHRIDQVTPAANTPGVPHRGSARKPCPIHTTGGTAAGGRSLGNALRRTPLERKASISTSRLAEALRMSSKGSTGVTELLNRTTNAYVAVGRSGLFTPLYCFPWPAKPL